VQASLYPIAPNCTYTAGSRFYEFNGSSLTQVASPANAANDPSFVGRMLVLPSGQVLFTDNSTKVAVYAPSGTYQSAWQPTITSVGTTLTVGAANNSITGTQFNGLTQGAMYGDDAQSATNYPLVRITNNATGHVFYCKTHNHSTMGVATGSTSVSTQFDIPSNVESGASTIVVVANGIPSSPTNVTIAPGALSCTAVTSCYLSGSGPGEVVAGQVVITCNQATLLSASATICGSVGGCLTNSAAPPQPITSFGEGDASRGTSGSCSLSWSWGGNNYGQELFVQ
jgi:hypothetical protein